jgi:hypothetical protein
LPGAVPIFYWVIVQVINDIGFAQIRTHTNFPNTLPGKIQRASAIAQTFKS